ncbi:MAG: SRPBCC domain-containing protein [Anaerolineae bacterium]|nr:SRPBCC domain-containing protein [Anaerolineae bacterium]
MPSIRKQVIAHAPIEQVWSALVDRDAIAAWMIDETVAVDLRVGGAYAFFAGETTGRFTRVEAPTILEYTWRQDTWPAEWADSKVCWELEAHGSSTRIQLFHRDFPNEDERENHDDGWILYWLNPMIDWLEGR